MPPSTTLDPTHVFPVGEVDALIAELETTAAGEIELATASDTWPSEICTGRWTCINY
jgi:hypothetical protein